MRSAGIATPCCILFVILHCICGFSIPRRGLHFLLSQKATHVSLSDIPFPSQVNLQRNTVFYNTLTRRKEPFQPIIPGRVSFYSCGPTVYDFAHIGNFRAFLTYDIIKRWLMYIGYEVDHVCNLTDVDDKIIARMARDGKSLSDVTTFFSNAFFADLKMLNIIPAGRYPKATDYIGEIETMVHKLIEKQHAYTTNGSVYYRVRSFRPKYGVLASYTEEEQLLEGAGGAGPNARRGDGDKEDYRDFALWKAYTPSDGNVAWETSMGKGRPGWHIECSAMCHALLGDSIDIHSGGSDLVFPHHTNEILQSEAFTGRQFSRVWMHNGFVNINNEKMSKSLSNFKTLRDIVNKPIDARAFRFLVMSVQYRNPINFNDETITSAKNSLKRIDKLRSRLEAEMDKTKAAMVSAYDLPVEVKVTLQEFEDAMSDDLNTPRAFAALFKLVQYGETLIKESAAADMGTPKAITAVHNALSQIDRVLGLFYEVPMNIYSPTPSIPKGLGYHDDCSCCSTASGTSLEEETLKRVRVLAEQRAQCKEEKLFVEADSIRQQITQLGFGVKDTKNGFEIFQLE